MEGKKKVFHEICTTLNLNQYPLLFTLSPIFVIVTVAFIHICNCYCCYLTMRGKKKNHLRDRVWNAYVKYVFWYGPCQKCYSCEMLPEVNIGICTCRWSSGEDRTNLCSDKSRYFMIVLLSLVKDRFLEADNFAVPFSSNFCLQWNFTTGKTAQAVARTRSTTLLPKESVDTTNPALTQGKITLVIIKM